MTDNQQAAREWLPIESAPKDGTRIAVRFDGGFDGEANWQTTYGGEWHVKSFTHLPWHEQPTHWQPLPAPPRPTQESGTHE